ncbi:MAG: hypothetical protein JWP49_985 [Phenylobacterium sp.]|jgi:hypothetical protein|nr:hypothetical protein [Phenylobacterium sp.]
MNTDTARDDLAFMRALVQPDEAWQRQFGETYLACGLCYGGQMLMHAGQMAGLLPYQGTGALVIGLGPTVVFMTLLIWLIWRNRGAGGGGVTSRAVGSVFGALGLANLALIVVIGSLAWREHSITIWLLYPCVVLVLQGMAWLVAYMLRRKAWFAVVALGWFATGIAMALAIKTLGAFIFIGGVGFFALMAIPGYVMMRQSRGAA